MTALFITNIAPLMFAMLIVLLMIGYPVAFSLAANGLLFGAIGIHYGLLGPDLIQALPQRVFGIMSNDTLLAIPFFQMYPTPARMIIHDRMIACHFQRTKSKLGFLKICMAEPRY